LAVSSVKRSLAAPNASTVTEQTGIRGFDLTNWVGVFARRGTPADVVQRLNRDINHVLGQPDVLERLVRHGAEPAPMSVDQFADFLKSEAGKYGGLLQGEFCAKLLYGGCTGFVALP
jgi:tripartite-type tricarboxylate transporter receptor subunit TctC